jgi:hemoglobin
MELKIKNMPFGERTNQFEPSPLLLDSIGEEGMRKLVSDHYDLLVESEIKDIFPKTEEGLKAAKQNSADYFIERLGGPKYFNENRGKPMLSRRHAPFKITPESRVVWLDCYRQLLPKLDAPEEAIRSFWDWLNELSNWMVNALDQYKDIYIQRDKGN